METKKNFAWAVIDKIKNFEFWGIAIGSLALIATIIQGWHAREHNKLSVRPYLTMAAKIEGPGGKNGIFIENAGLGTAIIKKAIIRFNQIDYDFNKIVWPEILGKKGIDKMCFERTWLPVDAAITTTKEEAIIKLTRADSKGCYLEISKLVLNNQISVKIEYESLYKESFVVEKEVSLQGLGIEIDYGKLLLAPKYKNKLLQ